MPARSNASIGPTNRFRPEGKTSAFDLLKRVPGKAPINYGECRSDYRKFLPLFPSTLEGRGLG
jgi:hypothetical protein